PNGALIAGKVLTIERGLAELHFQGGARVVLEGPARLELLSARSARLLSGKLTARVPGGSQGFELLSPGGKVVDLGTELGVKVVEGVTDVVVFEGKVEAHPAAGKEIVTLTQNQAARIEPSKVTPQPPGSLDGLVRAISPLPTITPRTLRLAFNNQTDGSLRD